MGWKKIFWGASANQISFIKKKNKTEKVVWTTFVELILILEGIRLKRTAGKKQVNQDWVAHFQGTGGKSGSIKTGYPL